MRLLAAPVLVSALLLALPTAAAAQTSAPTEEAAVVINGDVTVRGGEAVEGVFIVNGDARIAGRVDGDVVLVAGDVVLGGRVDGDLVTIAGRATLLPGSSVGEDLIYGDEEPRVSPRATIEGEVEEEDWTDSVGLFPFIGAIVLWLAITVSAAVLGILLLLLAPRAADAAFEQARQRFWTAVGIGAGIFIALPLACFLAAITLLGLPLALALGFAMLPLLATGYVTGAWALGRVVVKPPRGRILAFLAGLGILRAAALVPVLGALVTFATAIVGLGLLGGAIFAARQPAGDRRPAEARAPDS